MAASAPTSPTLTAVVLICVINPLATWSVGHMVGPVREMGTPTAALWAQQRRTANHQGTCPDTLVAAQFEKRMRTQVSRTGGAAYRPAGRRYAREVQFASIAAFTLSSLAGRIAHAVLSQQVLIGPRQIRQYPVLR